MNNNFDALKLRIVTKVELLKTSLKRIVVALPLSTIFILNTTTCFADEEYNRQLEEQAYDFIYDLAQEEIQPDEKVEIELSKISSGTNYPICEGELKFENAGGKLRRNNSIKIACRSETTPYYFYLSARVTVSAPFVTVINAVPRGTVLTADNLTIDYMNKVLDRGTAFTDPAELDGVRTKRDLKPGSPISKNQICVICRGDEVFIEASHGALSVKTKGEAMQDGSYHEKIRVKNLKSGKVVRGEVLDHETVSVISH